MYFAHYPSPIGLLEITADDRGIAAVMFAASEVPKQTTNHNRHTEQALGQLQEYFSGKRKVFELTLAPQGTAFQQGVWNELCLIPYGKTVSYHDVAYRLNNLGAIRAVGAANGSNPIAIIVPCHRVIGANGQLTGYAGGLWRKEWLLRLENALPQGILF